MVAENAIEVSGLTKRYGTVTALDGVSFRVGRGELFGLIGPDGAGKTTLFRLLTTLLVPDAGFAAVDGFDTVRDYRRIRERVGYMPGRFSLYPDLSVGENLAFFAALFGVEIRDNYELIAPIYSQIEPFRTRRAGKLSGGMKQKLALCCALVHRPSVLLLDEPTTGVDAVSRSEFWDMLSELKRRGISILVSTPYMDEARRCDRIALCNEGRVLGIDTPQGIVGTYGDPLYALSATTCTACSSGRGGRRASGSATLSARFTTWSQRGSSTPVDSPGSSGRRGSGMCRYSRPRPGSKTYS